MCVVVGFCCFCVQNEIFLLTVPQNEEDQYFTSCSVIEGDIHGGFRLYRVTEMLYRNSRKVIDLFHQHRVDWSQPGSCHRDVGPFYTPPRRHFIFLSLQWAAVWHFAPPAQSLDPIWTWKALIHQSTAGTRFNPHFCRGTEHPPVSKGSAVDSDGIIADIKLENHIIGIFTRSGCKQNKIHVVWLEDYIIYLASVGSRCIVQNLSCRLDSDLFASLE